MIGSNPQISSFGLGALEKFPFPDVFTKTLGKLLEEAMQNHRERFFSLTALPSRYTFLHNYCLCNSVEIVYFISARSGEVGTEEGMAC